jgi:hypothetical protein
MSKYIFLDNWVYSLLNDAEIEHRLSAFLKHRGYTILTTSLSQVELYNPNWENAGEKDRMKKAANLLSKNPSVIVNPQKVYVAEIESYPDQASTLPVELDLSAISDKVRESTLLKFLRGDEIFVKQGKNIKNWSENYAKIKTDWFKNVDNIIEHACKSGYLKRDSKGRFIELQENKELFLLSLDFREVNPELIDALIAKRVERSKKRKPMPLTAVRLSSLCFWYAYIDIDQANKMKNKGSDIGDFYHISLLPYCAAFTADGSMYRMLQRIREPIAPVNCEVITKQKLTEYLSKYK